MAEVEQETQAEEAQPDDAPTDAPVVGAIGESDAETAQTTEEAELVHKSVRTEDEDLLAMAAEHDAQSLEQLEQLDDRFEIIRAQLELYEDLLRRQVESLTSGELKNVLCQLPTLNGDCDRLQAQVDGVTGSESVRTRRKKLVSKAADASARLHEARREAIDKAKELAEVRKAQGNVSFQSKQYTDAAALYTEAIELNRDNPVYYSNRSACFQAKADWGSAIGDAQSAVSCDCNFLKGYIHHARCSLQTGNTVEGANVVLGAPMALQRHPDLAQIKNQVAEKLKTEGNALHKKGDHSAAIELYTLASRLEPTNPVYHSNKSACFQAQRRWKEGAASAREAIAADEGFVKGYTHLVKSLAQIGRQAEARAAVEAGICAVHPDPEKGKILNKLLTELCMANTNNKSHPDASKPMAQPTSSGGGAAALKDEGNRCYKSGDYGQAIKLYSQAITADPKAGAYYGNRAACWMMLKQYDRVVKDCSAGLALERVPGELGKLRVRMANALLLLTKLDRAADVLQEGVMIGGEHTAAIEAQLGVTRGLLALQKKGQDALEREDWSTARDNFTKLLQTAGLEEHCEWRTGLLNALYGLEHFGEAARMAQLVISDQPDSAASYLIRARSLRRMGLIEKAVQTLTALLQRDPENQEVSAELKRFRHIAAETNRIDQAVESAFKSRNYELAISAASEGAALDSCDKKLTSRMLLARGRARHLLAKATLQTASKEETEEATAKAHATWCKALHDAQSASYHEENELPPFLLRAEILQGLERWDEAVLELKDAIARGPGAQDVDTHNKLMNAEFLVRKSKRVDLYGLLGVEFGCKASEREIRAAYKQQAILYHPDKQTGKSQEEKDEATARFKQLGEALEVLTDQYMRKLWDEGHDLASIKQHVEMQKQQQQSK